MEEILKMMKSEITDLRNLQTRAQIETECRSKEIARLEKLAYETEVIVEAAKEKEKLSFQRKVSE